MPFNATKAACLSEGMFQAAAPPLPHLLRPWKSGRLPTLSGEES